MKSGLAAPQPKRGSGGGGEVTLLRLCGGAGKQSPGCPPLPCVLSCSVFPNCVFSSAHIARALKNEKNSEGN